VAAGTTNLALFSTQLRGIQYSFYRAMRMHSADYAVARCLSVRLSVRPSHAGIVRKRLHIILHVFSQSGSPTILVFPYQTGWQMDPRNGGAERKGCEIITVFYQYRCLSRKCCKIEP